jgi:hypothetical protein
MWPFTKKKQAPEKPEQPKPAEQPKEGEPWAKTGSGDTGSMTSD